MQQETQPTAYAVEMRNIVKKFGNFVANDHINLCVAKGEVHAILGENGAGKSTLMNVLYGLHRPSSGALYIHGKPCVMHGPSTAIACGVGMVHQHFMLVQTFTVTENIILGMEPTKGLVVDLARARTAVGALAERYHMQIDLDAKVEDISVGMQQRVEILKVLYRGADILILDEPTASLTPQEIVELMQIIKSLTADGKTVLLITHKLKEITAVADRCTIIRAGKLVDTVAVKDASEAALAAMMVGRDVRFTVEKHAQTAGEVVLEIASLRALDYRKTPILNGLDLQVRAGEIVGIAGVDGNGQTELVEILTGLKKATDGNITLHGESAYNVTPRRAFDLGITSIPADRQKHGLVLEFTVAENLVLQTFGKAPFSHRGVLRGNNILAHAKALVQGFDVRPAGSETRLAGTLSGGNQQKVIIAREVTNDSDLLIAVNPTRGLDVGAIEFVHQYLVAQRNKGKAVLLVSFELDEIINLSDRIAVIFEGQILGTMPGKDANEETLGLMMAGGAADA